MKQVKENMKEVKKKNKKLTEFDTAPVKKRKKEKEIEEEEESLVWEISACPDVVTEECKAKKRMSYLNSYLTCIHNVRKAKGWKMELLVEYNNGERQWAMFHGPLLDLQRPTAKLMKDCGLTLSVCGYKNDPNKMTEKKRREISSYDDFTHHNRTNYTILEHVIHHKLQNNKYNNNDDEEETKSNNNDDNIEIESVEDTKISANNNNNDDKNDDKSKEDENITETIPAAFSDNMVELIRQAAMRAADMAIDNKNNNNNEKNEQRINL